MPVLPVVIVGSGLAGYTLAREFRKVDKETPLTIISRDHAGFYSKPMLSNALAGKKTAATLVMKPAEKMAAELNASVRGNVAVQFIDTASRTLVLQGGETLAYRDLVLALGADPIRLPLEGDGADAVLSVNDLDDYARFAQQLEGAQTVAILGAGLIGCEFANDLLARGITPTLIDPADRALSRLLPPAASAMLQERLQAAGVRFRFGVAASAVQRVEDGLQLTLNDGSVLRVDRVLSAIGLRPRVVLAQEAGLAVNRGIACDRWLATFGAACACDGRQCRDRRPSLPYVMPIMQQARALAATLAGVRTPVAYPAMPVTVKTPACPTVVCPAAMHAQGEWVVTRSDDGCDARFIGADGSLLGFALLGGASAQKQTLAPQVPALIA